MDVAPPLNLSTSVKVESFVEEEQEIDEIRLQKEIQEQKLGNDNYVILQSGSNDETEVLTITGEIVADPPIEGAIKSADGNVLSTIENDESNSKINYECSQCSEVFARASLLRNHEKVHLQDKNLSCDLCSETFVKLSHLTAHKEQHSKKVFQCPVCNVSVINFHSYRSHLRKHRVEKKFKCSDCPMKFTQQSHLITHIRKHTGEKPFTCNICKNSFKQMSHLTTHMRTHTNDKPYVCDICQASFSQTGSLKRHKRSHTGEKPFKCDQCQALFVEKRNLTRHLLSHSGIRPFKCDLCTSTFTQYIDLKRHLFSHSGIKPFKCTLCNAEFSRKNNLKWHKLTHEGITPHKCDICDVGFRNLRDLKTHRKVHGEVKPFSCEHCKATFSQMTNLKRHSILHSGNKSFSCDKCSASFFEKCALKRHLLRHEGVKKFACDKCPSSFIESRALRRHRIVVHNIGKYEDMDEKITKKEVETKVIRVPPEEESALHIYEPNYARPIQSDIAVPNGNQPPSIIPNPSEASTQTVPHIFMSEPPPNSNQIPTLLIAAPGQPTKAARPAVNCQNHSSHFHTLVDGEFGQWQTWCFCETPNIPSDIDPLTVESSQSVTPVHVGSSDSQVSSTFNYATSVINNPTESKGNEMPVQLPQTSKSQGIQIHKVTSLQNTDQSSLFDDVNHHHSGYSESNQLQTYGDINQFSRNSPIEESIINGNGENEQLISQTQNVPLHSDKIAYNSDDVPLVDSLPVTFDVSSKKVRPLNKDEKNKVCNRHLDQDKMDLEASHILPHDLNVASFGAQGEIISSDDLAEVSQVTSASIPEIRREGVYYPTQRAFSEETVPQINFSEGEAASHSVIPEQGVEMAQQSIVNYNNVDKETVKDASHSLYEESAMSNADPKQIHMQYSLTVNNLATGDIQIQSDAFLPKSSDTIAKPPLKKRKMKRSLLKDNCELVCSYCPKTFQKQGQLELHQRSHTGEKPFICGVCHQSFGHNNSLTVHMRSHTGERPYSCSYCSASFTQKSNQRVHLRTHTGERPFKCNICGTSFSQSSHLTAHKRIHSNDRPYTCTTCNHAFTQKSALKRHEMKHASTKSDKSCSTCSEVLTSKEEIKNHNIMHGITKKVAKSSKSKTKVKASAGMEEVAEPIPKFLCSVQGCSEIFEEKKGLLEHIENNHDNQSDKTCKKEPASQEETSKASSEMQHSDKGASNEVDKTTPEKSTKLLPTRSSKRIRDAGGKKKFKDFGADFISGDLCEIDEIEQLQEEQFYKTRQALIKKQDPDKDSSEGVQTWCFCEVPHRPDEPHTHSSAAAATSAKSEMVVDKVLHEKDPDVYSRDNVLLTINHLPPHTLVVQDNQVSLPESGTNGPPLSINGHDILISAAEVPESQVIEANPSLIGPDNHLETQIISTDDQLIENNIIEGQVLSGEEGRSIYGQIISSQVLPGNQYVSQDGTLFIEAAEILNNGAVLLNSSPGTFFLDLSTDGQLINVPIGINNFQESTTVAVAGSSSENPENKFGSFNSQPISSAAFTPSASSPTSSIHSTATTFKTNSALLNGVTLSNDTESVELQSTESHVAVIASPASLSGSSLSKSNERSSEEKSRKTVVVPQHCSVCLKVFAQKRTLKQHMDECHPGIFYCTICFDAFTSNDHLSIHKSKHKTSYSCQDCNVSFAYRNAFNKHRQTVHNVPVNKRKEEKPFSCDQCDSRFFQYSDLKRHMLGHTGVKPYKCDHCGAGFTRQSSLNKHERIHTGDKPYHCTKCDQSFAYRYQFNKHKCSGGTSCN